MPLGHERRYTLSGALSDGPVLADAPTAEELVAAVVRRLPSGFGPVTSGAGLTDERLDLVPRSQPDRVSSAHFDIRRMHAYRVTE